MTSRTGWSAREANRLTGYTYDANGNMSQPPGMSYPVVYDIENRLICTAVGACNLGEQYAYAADVPRESVHLRIQQTPSW